MEDSNEELVTTDVTIKRVANGFIFYLYNGPLEHDPIVATDETFEQELNALKKRAWRVRR